MKTLVKKIQVEVEGKKFNVVVRSVYHENLNNPSWGKNYYSATFADSGNCIGGMMQRQTFRRQLSIAAKHLS